MAGLREVIIVLLVLLGLVFLYVALLDRAFKQQKVEQTWPSMDYRGWFETTCPPAKSYTFCSVGDIGGSDVFSAAFSSDGKFIAFAVEEYNGMDSIKKVSLWGVTSAQLVRTLSGFKYSADSIAFSPNGRFLATSSCSTVAGSSIPPDCVQNEIKLWDVPTGREVWTRSVDSRQAYVTFSSDGKHVASTSDDPTVASSMIKLWEVDTGQEVTSLDIGASTQDIRLWYELTGTSIPWLLPDPCRYNCPLNGFSPDKQLQAYEECIAQGASPCAAIDIFVKNAANGRLRTLPRNALAYWGRKLAFSPDSKLLLTFALGRFTKLWYVGDLLGK